MNYQNNIVPFIFQKKISTKQRPITNYHIPYKYLIKQGRYYLKKYNNIKELLKKLDCKKFKATIEKLNTYLNYLKKGLNMR